MSLVNTVPGEYLVSEMPNWPGSMDPNICSFYAQNLRLTSIKGAPPNKWRLLVLDKVGAFRVGAE